jgi:hypothetical protein
MKKLLLIFFAAVLLPSTDAITLYNATEWKSITSFSGTNGQTYSIYKPVCTGNYLKPGIFFLHPQFLVLQSITFIERLFRISFGCRFTWMGVMLFCF